MNDRRRGLGRGLGALIPTTPGREGPVDVFFPARPDLATAPADSVDQQVPSAPTRTPYPPQATEPTDRADSPEQWMAMEAASGAPLLAAGESPATLADIPGLHLAEVAVEAVVPNPRQPRQAFDEDELLELAESIRTVGLLQPIVVRPAGSGRYELVMGERRWRAVQYAGLATVSAIVRDTPNDALLRDALLENLHRSQLNAIEEAAAYQQLLEDFGCTHDELAARLSRSRPQISNTLRLLRLPALVQRRLAAGVLSAGHARALLGLDDPAEIERLAQRIVAEGLSVRSVEEIVSLGGAARPARAPRPAPEQAPRLADLAAQLSERLDTRVHVDLGRHKGKVTIEFAGLDDLERIMSTLAPVGAASEDSASQPAELVAAAAGW